MTWNVCKAKNISGSTKVFYNKELANNEEYTIPDEYRSSWINDTIYGDIAADDLQIGDSSAYFTSYADQWDHLQNQDNTPRDTDGSPLSRVKITKTGWDIECHTVKVETSKLNSVSDKDADGTDYDWGSVKFYDSEDTELTTQNDIDTDCVKTVLSWEPDKTIQIIGGEIYPGAQAAAGTELWFCHPLSGHEFCTGGFDLSFLPAYGKKSIDGRAPKELSYVEESTGTKCELVVRHSAGYQKKLQLVLELYTS